MKAVVPRKDLLRLIGRCLPASVDGVTAHGKCVLITAEPNPDQLRMCAVGLRLSVDSYVGASAVAAGSTVVESRRLLALVEAMPEKEDVTLNAANDRLTVSSGRRRYSLPTLPVDSFPAVPEMPENETPYLIGSQALAHVVETTRFAMDEGREQLNGILLLLSVGRLDGLAFRGACVAKSTVRAQGVVVGETRLFLPEGCISSVLSLCKESPNVACDLDNARLYIETEETLVSSMLPAQAADWETIISNLGTIAQDPVCALDGAAFQNALKAMLTADPTTVVALTLNAPTLDLSVPDRDKQASGLDLAEKLELHAGSTDARGASAVVNAKLLSHAVEPCDVVELRVAGSLDPVCVRAKDGTFMSIIMPMMR